MTLAPPGIPDAGGSDFVGFDEIRFVTPSVTDFPYGQRLKAILQDRYGRKFTTAQPSTYLIRNGQLFVANGIYEGPTIYHGYPPREVAVSLRGTIRIREGEVEEITLPQGMDESTVITLFAQAGIAL